MRSSNPTLKSEIFTTCTAVPGQTETMTIGGTVNKSALMLLLVFLTSACSWSMFINGSPWVQPLMYVGIGGGLLMAIVTVVKKQWSAVTAPVYALFQGLFLGSVSAIFEAMFPGIVVMALTLTMGTFLCLLLAYKSGYIKATENFKLGVVAATGAIAVVYLLSFVLNLFGSSMPYIHDSGWMGIGFSLFVVVIAALNLVLDFDFIEQGSAAGAPKYMEWYAAFGLTVTLIWLYLEILRLLSKIMSKR
ncbi:Bax inhibitor-1/YccA family protein [Cytophagaceae bacterium ABcell3]|nr:Bax inhibitor-1/YccA family protein [Cytophagaceae bacterium ABcell3]